RRGNRAAIPAPGDGRRSAERAPHHVALPAGTDRRGRPRGAAAGAVGAHRALLGAGMLSGSSFGSGHPFPLDLFLWGRSNGRSPFGWGSERFLRMAATLVPPMRYAKARSADLASRSPPQGGRSSGATLANTLAQRPS